MPLSPQIVITPETVTTKNFDITGVTFTSSTATFTAPGHTFSVGDIVLVSGIAPDGYNGTFTITGIATNTFTVSNATNAAVTDGVGNAFWADPSEFEFANYDAAYIPDNNDVNDLIATNPSLAQALADAAAALADAANANATATAAAYTAGVAQTAANGKNTSHYSTSGPSGGGTAGDLWFQVNGGGTVVAQYAYNGSSWISAPISNSVIANLDAGKITAGTITGIAINNGSGTFSVSPSGALVASSANITGTINATSGTFTGTVNAASGNIGGWTLDANRLYSGSSELNATNGNAVFNNMSAFGQIYGYGSAYASTWIEAGTYIRANGALYAAGHGTTSSAANGYVNASSGIIARSTASSQRYKENIVDLVTVPELDPKKLLNLPVRAFTYKPAFLASTDDRFEQMMPGFIAEEVDAIYPIAADYLDGPESWNDRMLVPALLALIQDQEKRIQLLEGK